MFFILLSFITKNCFYNASIKPVFNTLDKVFSELFDNISLYIVGFFNLLLKIFMMQLINAYWYLNKRSSLENVS